MITYIACYERKSTEPRANPFSRLACDSSFISNYSVVEWNRDGLVLQRMRQDLNMIGGLAEIKAS
jgi:hypothetical protein